VDPRRLAVAIACSLVVAGAVVLLALAQRAPEPKQTVVGCGKPFPGTPLLSFDLPNRYPTKLAPLRAIGGDPRTDGDLALALTAAEYNAGKRAEAQRSLAIAAARLGDQDTRVEVASALLGWTRSNANDVKRTLEGIASDKPNDDGLPLLERGIVALWQGCSADAADWLGQAKVAGPDSYYGVIADNLLHPNQNLKYPPFIPSEKLLGGSVEARRRAAAAHPDSSPLALAYAVALQGVGQRAKARAAAQQAVAADPTDLDAQVAAIVLGYDKDAPASAVGALGGLIKTNPNAPSPVLHLGLLLLWIHEDALAAQEFAKAAQLVPAGKLRTLARAFEKVARGPKG
jgi:tetratricopeptide (TPR) repeat protein